MRSVADSPRFGDDGGALTASAEKSRAVVPLERERRWVRAELCAVPNSRPCGSRRSRGSRTAQTTASVSLSPTSGRSSGSVTRRRRRGWGQAEPPPASPSLGGRYPSHPGNRRSTYPSINNRSAATTLSLAAFGRNRPPVLWYHFPEPWREDGENSEKKWR